MARKQSPERSGAVLARLSELLPLVVPTQLPFAERMWHFRFHSWLLISLLNLAAAASQAENPPPFIWAQQGGGASSGGDQGTGLAVDAAGNVFITGFFYGSATFGSSNVLDNGNSDLFLAKYSKDGQLIWIQSAGGTDLCRGYGVASGPSGSAYVVGRFRGMATFGVTNLTSFGDDDVFVAKYTQTGAVAWVRQVGGIGGDEGKAIAVDAQENVFVTGSFFGNASFGTTNLTSTNASYGVCFIAKYDSGGTLVWVRNTSGGVTQVGKAIAVDASSSVFVAGQFRAAATVGTNILTNASSQQWDVFVTRLDSSGNFLWVRQVGNSSFAEATGIGVDSAGSVVVGGGFLGTLNIGASNVVSAGQTESFLVKFTASGDLLWVRNFGGPGISSGRGLALDSVGKVSVTGNFRGTATFGATNLVSSSSLRDDAFAASFDSNGSCLWVVQAGAGASGGAFGNAIATSTAGMTFATGAFGGTGTFGANSLMGGGTEDMFLFRLGEELPALTFRQSAGNLVLGWPVAATNFNLEAATNLSSPQTWSSVAAVTTTNGLDQETTMPVSGGVKFFRLRRP